ncbi:MAG: hypothetical protein ACKVU0_16880 [Saprospiraceae bacterium]
MTEQQAQSPIDDLFRTTFENLPDSPAESGWDTPSDRVWQHVQTNISKPGKTWGTQSLVLIAAFVLMLAAGLYWLVSGPTEKPAASPDIAPVEQPVVSPPSNSGLPVENQPVTAPKPYKGNGTAKEDTQSKPVPRNSTEENKVKSGNNAAQPLPGSKTTLPPNSTEAEKKKGEGN